MTKANSTRVTCFLVFLQFAIFVLCQGSGTQFITGPCKNDTDCASGCCAFNTGECAGPIYAKEQLGGCGYNGASPGFNVTQDQPGSSPDTNATQSSPGDTPNFNVTQTLPGEAPNVNVTQEFPRGLEASVSSVEGLNQLIVTASSTGGPPPSTATDFSAGTLTQSSPGPASTGTQFITGSCQKDADCASGCCGFNIGECAGPIFAQEQYGGCGFGDAQPNSRAADALRGVKKREVPFSA